MLTSPHLQGMQTEKPHYVCSLGGASHHSWSTKTTQMNISWSFLCTAKIPRSDSWYNLSFSPWAAEGRVLRREEGDVGNCKTAGNTEHVRTWCQGTTTPNLEQYRKMSKYSLLHSSFATNPVKRVEETHTWAEQVGMAEGSDLGKWLMCSAEIDLSLRNNNYLLQRATFFISVKHPSQLLGLFLLIAVLSLINDF